MEKAAAGDEHGREFVLLFMERLQAKANADYDVLIENAVSAYDKYYTAADINDLRRF
jgi:hypothetical protein